jgi:DnaJ-domain-containing protein 1
MPRKTKKKRPSPFDKGYAPYGTADGHRGSPAEWRASFADAWQQTTAEEILGDDDPWSVLGLEPGAPMDEMKRAFRKLMRENHPDLAPESEREAATERTKRIISAYTVLGGN